MKLIKYLFKLPLSDKIHFVKTSISDEMTILCSWQNHLTSGHSRGNSHHGFLQLSAKLSVNNPFLNHGKLKIHLKVINPHGLG